MCFLTAPRAKIPPSGTSVGSVVTVDAAIPFPREEGEGRDGGQDGVFEVIDACNSMPAGIDKSTCLVVHCGMVGFWFYGS